VQLTTDLDAPEGPVVKMVGEVDLASATQLRTAGRAAVEAAQTGGQVVFDVREVTFLDSTGVGAMVDVLNEAAIKQAHIVLRSAPERVRRILEITGLLDRFTLEP
jgi:anti-sigma B factor antagonist